MGISSGSVLPDVAADGEVGIGDLMAALQDNARNFASQFEQVDGMIQSTATVGVWWKMCRR